MAATTTVNLHAIAVPSFLQGLRSLSHVLHTAEQHAAATSTPAADLLAARLAPDMAALPFQIQRVSDYAKMCLIRVGGTPAAAMPDTEETFADLQARLRATIAYVEAVDAATFLAAVEDAQGADVVFRVGTRDHRLSRPDYVLKWALPQFWFHISVAYGILRMKGVPIGKTDFLNNLYG